MLNRIALYGAVLGIFTMILGSSIQVVARYVFFSPPVWTEELVRYAMVWAGMLGASCAYWAGADPSLFPGMRQPGGIKGKLWATIRVVGTLLFVSPVIYYSLIGLNGKMSFGFLGRSLARTAETLDVTMIWVTAAVPIGCVLVAFHAIAGLCGHVFGDPDDTRTQSNI